MMHSGTTEEFKAVCLDTKWVSGYLFAFCNFFEFIIVGLHPPLLSLLLLVAFCFSYYLDASIL